MGHRRSGGRFSGGKVGRLSLVLAVMGALLVLSPNAALGTVTFPTGQSFPIAEDAGGGAFGTVTATSDDADTTVNSFAIATGNGGGEFSIDDSGNLSLNVPPGLNFEATENHTLGITATDDDGTVGPVDVTVAVTNVYDGPTVNAAGPFNVPEDATGNVATITATDGLNGPATDFSIASGNTGGVFDIDGGGALAVIGALDFETPPTSYTLGITATDGFESSPAVNFTVTVTDVDDTAPTITGGTGTFPVAENVPSGTLVTTITATDPDSTVVYSIDPGPGSGDFSINSGNGALTTAAALDRETTPSYTLTVRATGGAQSATGTVEVNVTNIDEPPTITGGTGTFPVPETAAIGTAVTTITATDPDSSPIVYSISAGPGSGDFLIGSTSGVITTATALDRETRASYSLTVVASAGGKSDSGTVVVNVTNVNEAPMVTVPSGTVVAGEDDPFTPVITFTDPDTPDTHTYSIDWGDGTAPSTGVATSPLGVAHTFTANDTFTVSVTVTDAGALADTAAFDVEVVDDPIAMTAGRAKTITEGSVVTITASFTDAGTFTHTATVDWGEGAPPSATGVTIDQTADSVTATHTYDTKGDADGETDYVPTIRLTRTNGSGVGTASVPVKMTNAAPTIGKFLITDANDVPKTTFARGETTKVTIEITDPGVNDTLEVRVSWQDGTPDFLKTVTGTGAAKRTVVATHKYTDAAPQTITAIINDGEGGTVSKDAATIFIVPGGGAQLETVGLVDPTTGFWNLRNSGGDVTSFFYGNPGDFPIIGDWDCDGDETPGMYRQSDGFVYLRNTNTQGVADIKFFFGNPGDIPIVGDTDGDGCDTVSIYRPSQSKVFIINKLGENNGGLGAAELEYFFGNPGDKPFVGDFNGNGVETIGLHRESTGLVYFRNSHTQGVADNEFIFGDPADRLVAGDWVQTGLNSPAVFRPGNTTFYFRHSNTQGNADNQFVWGDTPDLPVAGNFGLG